MSKDWTNEIRRRIDGRWMISEGSFPIGDLCWHFIEYTYKPRPEEHENIQDGVLRVVAKDSPYENFDHFRNAVYLAVIIGSESAFGILVASASMEFKERLILDIKESEDPDFRSKFKHGWLLDLGTIQLAGE